MKKVVFIATFLVLVLIMVVPAGATPPEAVEFISSSNYSFLDFSNPTGTWTSTGAIASNGELTAVPVHFGAGSPPGVGFQTAHLTEVISDAYGSITIRSQTHGYEWAFDGPYEHFEGTGRWVILSGTGAYEDLHGQGKVSSVIGDVDWTALTMNIVATYQGVVHLDPQE